MTGRALRVAALAAVTLAAGGCGDDDGGREAPSGTLNVYVSVPAHGPQAPSGRAVAARRAAGARGRRRACRWTPSAAGEAAFEPARRPGLGRRHRRGQRQARERRPAGDRLRRRAGRGRVGRLGAANQPHRPAPGVAAGRAHEPHAPARRAARARAPSAITPASDAASCGSCRRTRASRARCWRWRGPRPGAGSRSWTRRTSRRASWGPCWTPRSAGRRSPWRTRCSRTIPRPSRKRCASLR